MKLKRLINSANIDFYAVDTSTELELPFMEGGLYAGFPSPAEDYLELKIDLNKELIKNPSATFLGRVLGQSMKDAGISDGDVLVIDKSVEPHEGAIAVCYVDGAFTVKRIHITGEGVELVPANEAFPTIKITEENQFMIWGIVTFVIKKM